ncbi:MAG TPA: hypothetical protein VFN10_03670 [Thermoanaerobaculia bacterium]|nr:hypothetical protein [Thermoanaerobaculia bacterium]
MRFPAFAVAVCLLVVPLCATAAAAAPALQFAADGIIVRGVTPKASVYIFGIAREANGSFSNVVPLGASVADSDGDGIVEWALGRPLAQRSMWIAVDMTNGTWVTAAPAGYPVTIIPLTDTHLKKTLGSDVDQLAFDGTRVDFLVVRPGSGAWHSVAGLDGPDDETPGDDKITLSSYRLEPQGGTTEAAPKQLKKGDVVFIVDSFHAAYGAASIGEAK